MKRVYAAVILLVITAVLCIGEFTFVCGNSDEFIRRIENIEAAVKEGDTDMAIKQAQIMEKDWEESVSITDMLLYHDYVDEIGCNLSELAVYIEEDEKGDFFSTCERTKEELQSLKDSELPTFKNIL